MREILASDDIQRRIFKIRGHIVMLDRDLAGLYGVKTIALRQQMNRNPERFPEDFAFQLSTAEAGLLVSQSVIPSRQSLGGSLPYVFTEEGIAMLSSVLRSPQAIRINIAIMRAFVKLRHALIQNRDVLRRIERIEGKLSIHDTGIRFLQQDVEKLKRHPGPDGPITPYVL